MKREHRTHGTMLSFYIRISLFFLIFYIQDAGDAAGQIAAAFTSMV